MLHCNKSYKYLIAVILILGLIISAFGIIYLNQVKSTQGWKIAKGNIIDLGIDEIPNAGKDNPISFYPDIKYEYSYEGQTYFNQSIGYYSKLTPGVPDGVFAGTESEVQDFLKGYSLNSIIDVYINPNNPSESIIVKNIHLRDFIYLLIGFFLIIFAVHLFVFRKAYFYYTC